MKKDDFNSMVRVMERENHRIGNFNIKEKKKIDLIKKFNQIK